jgi:hypothetical protein
MTGRHPVATVVEDAAHQNGRRVRDADMPFPGILGQLGLDGFERGTIEDRLMLADVGLAPIDHLADVEAVLEEMREGPHAILPASFRSAA